MTCHAVVIPLNSKVETLCFAISTIGFSNSPLITPDPDLEPLLHIVQYQDGQREPPEQLLYSSPLPQ
jgi:hypothetical protein